MWIDSFEADPVIHSFTWNMPLTYTLMHWHDQIHTHLWQSHMLVDIMIAVNPTPHFKKRWAHTRAVRMSVPHVGGQPASTTNLKQNKNSHLHKTRKLCKRPIILDTRVSANLQICAVCIESKLQHLSKTARKPCSEDMGCKLSIQADSI